MKCYFLKVMNWGWGHRKVWKSLWSLWYCTLISLLPHHSPSLFLIFLTRVWEYCSEHWRRQNLLYFICHLWNSTLWFLIGWNWRPTWNHLWEKHCKSGEGLSSEYCLYVNPDLCDPIGFSLAGSRRDHQGLVISLPLLRESSDVMIIFPVWLMVVAGTVPKLSSLVVTFCRVMSLESQHRGLSMGLPAQILWRHEAHSVSS